MKIKVMYASRGGNTKKVAEAIGQAVGQTIETVPPAYPADNVKLMFLGSGVYAGKPDQKIVEYIRTLRPSQVKNVALFGTMGGQDAAIVHMRDLLKVQGINVLEETFTCPGKFFIFFNRKHPTAEELKAAKEFAQRVAAKMQE